METVYLALGSNVGDPAANIEKATNLLGKNIHTILQAPIYRSKAVGYIDQPDFLNTAICGQTDLSPEELFKFAKQIEAEVGRVERFRWGPREIDIDIIFYGQQIIRTEQLTIPHPRFAERDFVLKPLTDLSPQLIDPVSQCPIINFLTDLKDRSIFNADSPS